MSSHKCMFDFIARYLYIYIYIYIYISDVTLSDIRSCDIIYSDFQENLMRLKVY